MILSKAIQKLKEEEIQVLIRLAVLIFIGGGINSFLLGMVVISYTEQLQINPELLKNQFPFITTSPQSTLAYLGVAIVYSIGASLSFIPKRIVSPIYIQLVTATIFSTLITYYFISHSVLLDSQIIGGFILLILTIFVILGIIGWLQSIIVRRLIGVSGNKDKVDTVTYSITLDYEKVAKTMTDKQFLTHNEFTIKEDSNNILILRSKWDSKTKHIMVLVPNTQKPKTSSLLSVGSYSILYDSLCITTKANDDRDGIIGYLQQKLFSINDELYVKKTDDDETTQDIVKSEALKTTKSPFSELKHYSKLHIFIVSSLLIIGVGVTVARFFFGLQPDTWVNVLMLIVVALIAEVFPLFKEKLSKPVHAT